MASNHLAKWKSEMQHQAKNGIDFILSAGLLWLAISYLWTLEHTAYNKSVFTFMLGALMLPLAFGLSKILRTNWKVKANPLQPLGLWLNLAQLAYFPFLIFMLLEDPDYFVMAYAIITGAHLLPYAWFYDEMGYAVGAVGIGIGVLLITLSLDRKNIWVVPLFTSAMLFLLAGWILFRNKRRELPTPE